MLLPDTHQFLYTYIRKEAVLSSQSEGTNSTLSDLLLFEAEEAPGVPIDDVSEVSRYVAALEHGLGRLKDGFPLSNRLIREIHGSECGVASAGGGEARARNDGPKEGARVRVRPLSRHPERGYRTDYFPRLSSQLANGTAQILRFPLSQLEMRARSAAA